jgi:hypothetical protein
MPADFRHCRVPIKDGKHSLPHGLGSPIYFALIIGFWKVPGGLALLIPRFPRLKE